MARRVPPATLLRRGGAADARDVSCVKVVWLGKCRLAGLSKRGGRGPTAGEALWREHPANELLIFSNLSRPATNNIHYYHTLWSFVLCVVDFYHQLLAVQ